VTLVREDAEFETLIRNAAASLGITDPTFVEKDYWVTQVLRALTAQFPGGFVLKGGTSLSKGYSIINRFSEDVDVLVVPVAGFSNEQKEDHLREMTERTTGLLGLKWNQCTGRAGAAGRTAAMRSRTRQSFRRASA